MNSIQEALRRPEYAVPGAPGYAIQPIINYIVNTESVNGDAPVVVFRYILRLNDMFVDWFAHEHDAQLAALRNEYAVD